ncbi:response regulator transcription factor [Dactylosporangium sp. NPDC049525]|jgi:DNA-binding response OmpR family regulator|uniref:response regulator transcription factor n=1 Tax=Dactylosporangium sp. NPDC049525 TaxID=3154730 RepID=UPI00342BA5AF
MPLILLVEDDVAVSGALSRALTDAGHVVRPVGNAGSALRVIATDPPDLVILDLGLPDMDGLDVLRMLRGISNAPVIVATARRSERDIIRLLDAGADDYVTKPFSSAQMSARINAVLRRGQGTPGPATVPAGVTIGALHVNPQQRFASIGGQPLQLTKKEFDLLAYLAQRAGRVVSRRELLTEVWQRPDSSGEDQTIDVHVSWLRRKLGESATAPRYLRTFRGVGVMLVDPEQPPAQP